MDNKSKLNYAVDWFTNLSSKQQSEVVRELFHHAITSEWINVWSLEDRKEMVEDEGFSQAEVDAPYFTTCGEPLVSLDESN